MPKFLKLCEGFLNAELIRFVYPMERGGGVNVYFVGDPKEDPVGFHGEEAQKILKFVQSNQIGGQQQPLSQEGQTVLDKSVGELNLSVRARKGLNRLGIATLGELVLRSPDELLDVRNFGISSLQEVREKLYQFDLTLRGES
jgi:hypothetical protein